MGNSCSGASHGLSLGFNDLRHVGFLVTDDEIHKAVAAIDEWNEAQKNPKAAGGAKGDGATLLDRVGGSDVVKGVVDKFYQKLFADPATANFFEGYTIVHMRAKQSAFLQWLFGTGREAYRGKDVRCAHLKLIKRKGFSGEHFDIGVNHFVASMREANIQEALITETLARMLPLKSAIFTPSAKDEEEERRWAEEEEEADGLGTLGPHHHHHHKHHHGEHKDHERTVSGVPSEASSTAQHPLPEGDMLRCPFATTSARSHTPVSLASASMSSTAMPRAGSPMFTAPPVPIITTPPAPMPITMPPMPVIDTPPPPVPRTGSPHSGTPVSALPSSPSPASPLAPRTGSPKLAGPPSARVGTPSVVGRSSPLGVTAPEPAPCKDTQALGKSTSGQRLLADAQPPSCAAEAEGAASNATGSVGAAPPAAGAPKADAALAEDDDDLLALAHGISGLSNV